jgi:hypothetical protein
MPDIGTGGSLLKLEKPKASSKKTNRREGNIARYQFSTQTGTRLLLVAGEFIEGIFGPDC